MIYHDIYHATFEPEAFLRWHVAAERFQYGTVFDLRGDGGECLVQLGPMRILWILWRNPAPVGNY